MVLPVAAQDQPAIVRSDPAVLEIAPGEVATLTVVLTGARDVYGIDLRAVFDPQLVEVIDADPAREGAQFSPGTFPQPDFLVRNVADNQAGTLHYAIAQVNPTEPASGDGVLFTVQLRALAESGEGAFTIGPVEMADRTGVILDVQMESGLIRITPTGQTPTDQPATVAPNADGNQAATPSASAPETPAAAASSLPLLAVLALVAVVAIVIVVLARRRAAS